MKPLVRRIPVFLAMAAFLSLPVAERLDAADIQVKPSIRLVQGWDSNISNTSEDNLSDFYFSATPELVLSAATLNYSLQLSGGLEGRWYYENPDITPWDYSVYARLATTGGWKFTDRLTITPEAYYLKTFDQYQRSLLVPTEPSLPAPPIATYGLQQVSNFGASLGLQYLATPTLETGCTVYYAAQDYPGQAVGSSDSRTYGATVTVRHLFSQLSSLGGYVSANGAEYDVSPDSQVLAFGILGGYQFSPAFKFDGRLGVSFAWQCPCATAPAQSMQAPAGTISLVYTDNTFQASLYANVGYSGLSGSGQITRQGTAGVSVSKQVTGHWSWNLGGTYQISRTVFAATNMDSSSLIGSAGIRYAPWEWGSFDLTGTAEGQWSDLPNSERQFTLNRYTATLGFTVGKTYTAF